jgi:hypothetical protein
MEIDDRTLLYKILYMGFLDIRIAACEEKPHIGFFRISDFLHNLPSQLELAGRENNDGVVYKNIMTELRERARIINCETWLNHAIQNIKENWKPIESESEECQ